MRKLILSGDDWFELKHTLELLVIVTNNAAEELDEHGCTFENDGIDRTGCAPRKVRQGKGGEIQATSGTGRIGRTSAGGEGMKKLLLTTAEWLYLKWMLERNMIRMDADAFRLKEGEPGSEARREAIGKELERIEKEHRNIERMLEKIEAAETVQTATDETEEKK